MDNSGKEAMEDKTCDEFDATSLPELQPYAQTDNDAYLENLIKRTTPKWADISDSDKWLSEIRGTED